MSDDGGTPGESVLSRLAAVDARLSTLRADDRQRRVVLVVAVALGLTAATVHWVGLFLAGALVGLTRQSLPRALLAGLGMGVLVLALFFLATPLVGPGNVLALAPLSYVTVAVGLLAPAWGALVRGAV